MRVALHLDHVDRCGGDERVLVELLRRSRHDWTVLTSRWVPDATFTGLLDADVRVVPDPGRGRLAVPPTGAAALLAVVADPARPTRLPPGLPAVAWCRSAPGSSAGRRALLRRTLYAHVLTDDEAGRAGALAARLAPSAEVVPAAVDAARWASRLDDADARDGLLVVAGRIAPSAQVERAVEAFRLARATGLRGRLVVAGRVEPQDRPYLERLRAAAEGLDVLLLPDPDDRVLVDLLGRASALLVPGTSGGALVALEAMAAGTPVLACAGSAAADVLVHDRTGWVLEPDAGALARQVLLLGVCGPRDLAPVRAACRARAAALPWERLVDRVDDVVEAVAARQPVPVAAPPVRALLPSRWPVAGGR